MTNPAGFIFPAPCSSLIGSGQRDQMVHALRPIPQELHPLLPLLTDTHNHICGYGEEARISFANDVDKDGGQVADMHAAQYVVVSVEPNDWRFCHQPRAPDVTESSEPMTASTGYALGIHPQCADEFDADVTNPSWLYALREGLTSSPHSIVGECGLDKNTQYREAFESHQIPIFVHHLRIAAELNRPMSVHCVKADGALVDILEREVDEGRPLPPTICLHSFSGSFETLCRIINVVEGRPKNKKERLMQKHRSSTTTGPESVRVFVGFNAWTNLYKRSATQVVRGLVRQTPHGECRVLVESDWNPIDFDFDGSDRRDADKILINSLVDIAEIMEWGPRQTATILAENAMRFFS